MDTLKEQAKKFVIKILKELDSVMDEVERSGGDIKAIVPELIFTSPNRLATDIEETGKFNKSTARDAIKELLDKGIITMSSDNYLVLVPEVKKVNNYIPHQLYATPLPLNTSEDSVYYIEVSDNMSPLLTDLFNKSVQRNDKRFYSIAHNLILVLDLAVPEDSETIVKSPFNPVSFLKEHGITVRNYNKTYQNIKGKTTEDLFEEEFDAYKSTPVYEGKLNTPRKVKTRIKPKEE